MEVLISHCDSFLGGLVLIWRENQEHELSSLFITPQKKKLKGNNQCPLIAIFCLGTFHPKLRTRITPNEVPVISNSCRAKGTKHLKREKRRMLLKIAQLSMKKTMQNMNLLTCRKERLAFFISLEASFRQKYILKSKGLCINLTIRGRQKCGFSLALKFFEIIKSSDFPAICGSWMLKLTN